MLATCPYHKQDEILTLNRKGSRETLQLSARRAEDYAKFEKFHLG